MKAISKPSTYLRTCLALSLIASNLLYAAQHDPLDGYRRAYPPYRVLPDTPSALPSGLSPAQVSTAYGFIHTKNQGQGQIIAIVDAYDNPNAEQDLAVFNSTFNLPPCTTANGCFQKIYAAGSQPAGNHSWGLEIALDIEWAHAMAPMAKIMLVEAADNGFNSLFDAINVAIKKGATIVSMSWGAGEFSTESSFDSYFNVPGVTFIAASGDGGTGALYPAASPSVIAVGGTTLNIDAAGNYISEKAWSGSGGGVSPYENEPASQASLPIPNNPNNKRGVPDVAYDADPVTGFAIYNTFGNNGWMVVGGTSAGAPQWAAIIAIAKSLYNDTLVDLNTRLYTFAITHYRSMYHDITSGMNGSCGYYCTAQKGYDYVTGLGSPHVTSLVNLLNT